MVLNKTALIITILIATSLFCNSAIFGQNPNDPDANNGTNPLHIWSSSTCATPTGKNWQEAFRTIEEGIQAQSNLGARYMRFYISNNLYILNNSPLVFNCDGGVPHMTLRGGYSVDASRAASDVNYTYSTTKISGLTTIFDNTSSSHRAVMEVGVPYTSTTTYGSIIMERFAIISNGMAEYSIYIYTPTKSPYNYDWVYLTNCIFSNIVPNNNKSVIFCSGGAAYGHNNYSDIRLTNCTFNNFCNLVCAPDAYRVELKNNIMNSIDHLAISTDGDGSTKINNNPPANSVLIKNTYNDYFNCGFVDPSSSDGWKMTLTSAPNASGNFDSDPLFTDNANQDFHLLCTSPCIDAGEPGYFGTSGYVYPNPNEPFYQNIYLNAGLDIGAYGNTDEATLTCRRTFVLNAINDIAWENETDNLPDNYFYTFDKTKFRIIKGKMSFEYSFSDPNPLSSKRVSSFEYSIGNALYLWTPVNIDLLENNDFSLQGTRSFTWNTFIDLPKDMRENVYVRFRLEDNLLKDGTERLVTPYIIAGCFDINNTYNQPEDGCEGKCTNGCQNTPVSYGPISDGSPNACGATPASVVINRVTYQTSGYAEINFSFGGSNVRPQTIESFYYKIGSSGAWQPILNFRSDYSSSGMRGQAIEDSNRNIASFNYYPSGNYDLIWNTNGILDGIDKSNVYYKLALCDNQILDDKLAFYINFDERHDGYYLPVNVLPENAAWNWTYGVKKRCIESKKTNMSYVTTARGDILPRNNMDILDSLFSISAYCKTTDLNGRIFDYRGMSTLTDYVSLYIKDGKPIFSYKTKSFIISATGSATINDNNWHQIIGVRDDLGTAKLYVDGTLAGSYSLTGGSASDFEIRRINLYPVIGAKYLSDNSSAIDNTGASLLEGSFDEIRFYKKALKQDEITKNCPLGTFSNIALSDPTNNDQLEVNTCNEKGIYYGREQRHEQNLSQANSTKFFDFAASEAFTSVLTSTDGGLITAGWCNYYKTPITTWNKVWLTKINQQGATIWEKNYLPNNLDYYGPNNRGAVYEPNLPYLTKLNYQSCNNIKIFRLLDGNYCVIFTSKAGINIQNNILKIDGNGNKIWQNEYIVLSASNPDNVNNNAREIRATTESGVNVINMMGFNWLVKFNAATGQIISGSIKNPMFTLNTSNLPTASDLQTKYGNVAYRLLSFVPVSDGFTACGHIYGGDNIVAPVDYRGLVVKLDFNGNLIWAKDYPEVFRFDLIEKVSNGDVVVAGQAHKTDNSLFICKMTPANGNLIWSKEYNTKTNVAGVEVMPFGCIREMKISAEDTIFLLNYYYNQERIGKARNNANYFILKCDPSGNVLWNTIFRSSGELPLTAIGKYYGKRVPMPSFNNNGQLTDIYSGGTPYTSFDLIGSDKLVVVGGVEANAPLDYLGNTTRGYSNDMDGFLCVQKIEPQNVSGDITSNTTWTSDVLLTGDVTVKSGATLQIMPGVKVQFYPNLDNTASGTDLEKGEMIIEDGGRLVATGTEQAPVIFTSYGLYKSAGDWGGIEISSSNNVFNNCIIENASTAVTIQHTHDNWLDHVEVRDCVNGLNARDVMADIEQTGITIVNSHFHDIDNVAIKTDLQSGDLGTVIFIKNNVFENIGAECLDLKPSLLHASCNNRFYSDKSTDYTFIHTDGLGGYFKDNEIVNKGTGKANGIVGTDIFMEISNNKFRNLDVGINFASNCFDAYPSVVFYNLFENTKTGIIINGTNPYATATPVIANNNFIENITGVSIQTNSTVAVPLVNNIFYNNSSASVLLPNENAIMKNNCFYQSPIPSGVTVGEDGNIDEDPLFVGNYAVLNQEYFKNTGTKDYIADLDGDNVEEYYYKANFSPYQTVMPDIGYVNTDFGYLEFFSPVDIVVYDPDSLVLDGAVNQIGDNSFLITSDQSSGGDKHTNAGFNLKEGTYTIKVYRDSTAQNGDVYSFTVSFNGVSKVMAINKPVPPEGEYDEYTFNYFVDKPSAPAYLHALRDKDKIIISWPQSESNVQSYKIYRSVTADTTINEINLLSTVDKKYCRYNDINFVAVLDTSKSKTTFHYKLVAIDSCENMSNVVSCSIVVENRTGDFVMLEDFNDCSDWIDISGNNENSGKIAIEASKENANLKPDYGFNGKVGYIFNQVDGNETVGIKKEFSRNVAVDNNNYIGFWFCGDYLHTDFQIKVGDSVNEWTWTNSSIDGNITNGIWRYIEVPFVLFESAGAPIDSLHDISHIKILITNLALNGIGDHKNTGGTVYLDDIILGYKNYNAINQGPLPPHHLIADARYNSIRLKWRPSFDVAGDLLGYKVLRQSTEYGAFECISELIKDTTFIVNNADCMANYCFKIIAFDTLGLESRSSNIVEVALYNKNTQASALIDDFNEISDWSEIWGYNVGAPPSGQITLTTDTCSIESTYSMKVSYIFDDTLHENVRIKKDLGGEFDYSGMNMLGFWVYGDSNFAGLQVSLGNDSGEYIWKNSGSNGTIINWRGWKRFDVPLSEFETGWPQEPEGGWSLISYAKITLSDGAYGGCGITTNINSSIYVDEMKLRYDPPYILADNFDDVTDWSEVWGYNVGAPPSGHVMVTSDTGVSIIGPRSVKIHYTLDDTTLPECVKMQKNFIEPLILSGYGKVGFWLFGDSSNTGFQVWLGNQDGNWIWKNSASRGTVINFRGWRKFEVPFSEFEPGWPHAPKDGWANIKYIGFTINDNCYGGCGYNKYVNSDIYLDDILVYNGNYPGHTNIPPEIPTNLTSTLLDSACMLSWTPSVNNEGDLEGYKVYYSFYALGDYLLLANAGNCTTYLDSTFRNIYSYTVTAYDSFGNESGRSNVAYVDITPPINDMTLSAQPLCSRVMALAWTPESLGIGEADSVAIYYSTTSYPESISQQDINLAGKYGLQRAIDTLWTLNPATTYYFSAFAVDWRNNWSNKGTAYHSATTLPASKKMYVSLTGRNIPPYDSPLMAGTDVSDVFDSLKASVRDTILFYTTGAYTESKPCSIRVNNAVIMTQPGTVCTLARASASTDSFPMVVINSVQNIKISSLAFNGNQTAGCAVQMNSALAMSPVLSGLDIFNLSMFDNGQGWIYDGAIVFGENDQSGKMLDCKIHNVPRHGIMVKDTGPNQYQGKGYMEIARCEFSSINGDAIHFWDTKAADVNIHHNLVYNCGNGINAVDSMMNDTIAYNTIYGCTGKGVALWGDNNPANYCVYRYNIAWGNDSDFVFFRDPYTSKTVDNIAGFDFNFNGYNKKNASISVGTGDITAYPQFADTTNDNYQLGSLSLCVDASNSSTVCIDKAGVQTPRGNFNDLGCFESAYYSNVTVQVDSVKYYSCGTGSVSDDSMLVYFDKAIDDDHSTTAACSAFSVLGLGSIVHATIRTGNVADDNILVVGLTSNDVVFSHNRTRLALLPNTIRTLSGGHSVTDTNNVVTFNVYNKRLATVYQTIQQAIKIAHTNDTINVTDNGYYTDTLSFDSASVIVGVGSQRPVIKYNGVGMDNQSSWKGHDLMVYYDRYGQVGPVFKNICWDGVSANNDTASTFAYMGSGGVKSCSLSNAFVYFSDAASQIILENTDIKGRYILWRSKNANSKISHCVFHNIYSTAPSGALTMDGGKKTLVERNIFQNNTGVALLMRGADSNTVVNNLIINNSGQAVYQYSIYDADLPVRNKFINNTICNNTGGGLELDSMGFVANNIVYGNSSWQIKKNIKAQVSSSLIKYNLVDTTNSGLGSLISGATNIVDTTNPRFVSSTDFHLQSSSPCVNFTDFNADSAQHYGVTVDLEGNTRPLPSGTNLDAGAFEQGGGSPKAVTQPLMVLAGGGEQQLVRGVQPNPFKMTTEISYRVISTDNFKVPTQVAVFDIYGNLVRRLVDECLPAGDYRAIWDGKNKTGKIVGNGIYYCKIQTGEKSESIRVMVIR